MTEAGKTNSPRTSWRKMLGSLAIMILGVTGVFTLILMMNAHTSPPKKEKKAGEQIMAVKQKKRTPPNRRRVERPQRKLKATTVPRAPLPQLASSLSGVQLDIPSLSGVNLEAASASMLGNTQAVKNMVMTEESVDQPPQVVQRVKPSYPPRALAKGIKGKVVLTFIVETSGDVKAIKVLEASPSGVFENAAISAVSQYRFSPGVYKGQKVKVRGRVVVRFDLG